MFPRILDARVFAMAALQSVADREDVVVVCRKPYPAYTGLDVLLARVHADGRFELLSEAWEAILGFRGEELDGKSLFTLLPLDERSARALLRRITDPREPDPLVFEIVCKSAGPLRMHWHRRFDEYTDTVFIAGLRAVQAAARRESSHA